MFEFFVKHAVCNRSVWLFVNKRHVNTACSNTLFELVVVPESSAPSLMRGNISTHGVLLVSAWLYFFPKSRCPKNQIIVYIE